MQEDGGDIVYMGFDDGVVKLKMQVICSYDSECITHIMLSGFLHILSKQYCDPEEWCAEHAPVLHT